MPAEWEPHAATWLSWPRREGISFPDSYDRVLPTSARDGRSAARVRAGHHQRLQRRARSGSARGAGGSAERKLTFHRIPTNEPWCRDHGPIFLTRDEEPRLAVVDWDYNAWGGKYPPCDLDEVVPTRVARSLGLPVFYPRMILEGGSIDVNGAGALLTTEALSAQSKSQSRTFREGKSSSGCAIISASAKFSGWATASKATTPMGTSMI